MSLDLTIYPLRGGARELQETCVSALDRIDFDGDYRIFGQLTDMSYCEEADVPKKPIIVPHAIPLQMWVEILKGDGLKRTRQNPYGEELVVVYAEQMRKLVIPDNASQRNKAIKAFVDALPDDTPIILEWH